MHDTILYKREYYTARAAIVTAKHVVGMCLFCVNAISQLISYRIDIKLE